MAVGHSCEMLNMQVRAEFGKTTVERPALALNNGVSSLRWGNKAAGKMNDAFAALLSGKDSTGPVSISAVTKLTIG